MFREVLRSKIHRARITDKKIQYEGSIGIASELCRAAGMVEGEKVLVANVFNGERFETYVQVVEEPGVICLNGAAGRLGELGDLVIIMAFGLIEECELADHSYRVVLVDEDNKIKAGGE